MRFALPAITPVVKWLLIINIAVFIPSYLIPSFGVAIYKWFSVWPDGPFQSLQIWRVISYQFLHSIDDLYHILMNMFILYFFGPMLERQWGSKKFLTFYLVCGAAGGGVYTLLVNMNFMTPIPLVGASGAIFGMLAAGAILYPHIKVLVMFVFPMSLRVLAIILAVISLLLFLRGDNAGGQAAHLAGMAAGAVYILWPRWRQQMVNKPRKVKWHSEINRQRTFQAEVDRVLDKVHKSGIGSLTRKEKKTLREASKHQQQHRY